MSERINRRQLLGRSTAFVAAGTAIHASSMVKGADLPKPESARISSDVKRRMKLGLVTYNLARDWDLATIVKRCEELGLAAVELRTTHKHGVEPSLSKSQRTDVKKRFADSTVVLWGLGTACEFHEPDPAAVTRNIEQAKQFAELAHDVGAKGVKVRPNRLPEEIDEEKTLEQIGRALRTCGETAAGLGVELWVEVHGRGTAHPPRMRQMMDIADHPNVGVTWNSNYPLDLKDGSIRPYFELLRNKIYSVHINELVNRYPYQELFTLLNRTGYDRYTLIEAQALKGNDVEDTIRFLKFYKALWEAWSQPSPSPVRPPQGGHEVP